MAAAADQRKVWTAIADSFDRTRQRPWPHVVDFLAALPEGSRVLDLMAGNGRHARAARELGRGLQVVALDWSLPLLRRAPEGRVLADATRLPLRTATFDAAVCVAALHGLPTAEQRAACLGELRSVLRAGGTAQVTVWSREAPRFRDAGLPPGPADVEVPWKAGGADERRAYHLYTARSLSEGLEAGGFEVGSLRAVALAGDEPDNLVAVVRA